MKHQNKEDYLRALYHFWEEGQKEFRNVDISRFLGFSKPAVSEMFKKMEKQGLLKTNPYAKVVFTSKGLKESQKLTYKHRVIEVFLKDVLKIDGQDMHKEAHKLEHALSDDVIKRLAKFLDNPKVCPGGSKIPKFDS